MSIPKPSHCHSCYGYCNWGPSGYVPADGTGANGVLVVLEAAGEHEAKTGIPTVGKAGMFLWQNLLRAGIEREGFKIHNVLSCQPGVANKLAGMPYEEEVIAHCAPLLDATINEMREQCARSGKTFTILTFGKVAFKRIMGFDYKHPILRKDYLCYPFWNEKYGAWVVAGDHPSYLMRGNSHLIPVMQFAARRALEIAEGGFQFHQPTYMRDPSPSTFAQWVEDYLHAAHVDPSLPLSFDIETPHKQGAEEDEIVEEGDDYTILRCSFAYRPGEAVSVRWTPEYRPFLEELFAAPHKKCGWNSDVYDIPRIRANGLLVRGDLLDGMLCWHVLNSALPKGLGFVAPFYCHDIPVWKYTSGSDPAGYNAMDADVALRCFLGIKADLEKNGQWGVMERHVVELNRVLSYMSEKGVERDESLRCEAEKKLQDLLDTTEMKMEASIPDEVRKLKVYKKAPKSLDGLVQVEGEAKVKVCPNCGEQNVMAPHFKSIGKKRLKAGEIENPCAGLRAEARTITTKLWAKPLEFKVSKTSLTKYQKVLRHQAIIDRKKGKSTFDEDAIRKLLKKHPNDPLYPLILEHREYQKLLSTYIGITQPGGTIRGGMPIGMDGRIHPQFSHNPSTLRLACQNPNMQNIPRAGGVDDLRTLARNLIVAAPNSSLLELDFAAIEAVLVGYFAASADYIRLAKLGIHAFLASHVLGRPADLSWSDADLKAYFKEIKKSKDPHVNAIYNSSKRTTHLSGYGGTPHKMHQSEPEAFPTVKDAEYLQGIYFEVCPYIKKWHKQTQLQAEKDGFLRNPFAYTHRFNRVFSYVKECGKWVKKPGDDANKCLAFLPQSTAAAIIKEAMLRLYYNRFEEAGQYLRLQVHDSLLSEVPDDRLEEVLAVKKEEMTRPIPQLQLPASYGLGEMLTIDVDAKSGKRWGEMS